jgi:hypothetical protein
MSFLDGLEGEAKGRRMAQALLFDAYGEMNLFLDIWHDGHFATRRHYAVGPNGVRCSCGQSVPQEDLDFQWIENTDSSFVIVNRDPFPNLKNRRVYYGKSSDLGIQVFCDGKELPNRGPFDSPFAWNHATENPGTRNLAYTLLCWEFGPVVANEIWQKFVLSKQFQSLGKWVYDTSVCVDRVSWTFTSGEIYEAVMPYVCCNKPSIAYLTGISEMIGD